MILIEGILFIFPSSSPTLQLSFNYLAMLSNPTRCDRLELNTRKGNGKNADDKVNPRKKVQESDNLITFGRISSWTFPPSSRDDTHVSGGYECMWVDITCVWAVRWDRIEQQWGREITGFIADQICQFLPSRLTSLA